ncbi:MAG: sigma-54-dependent Fis family transcriptional regulator [Bacteriovoracaceae bacterium]|nr:sigma-54-dependent Fis family transcriptional regulator [Bacteriovoracaceae bacterium]
MTSNTLTILVLDDEAIFRTLLKEQLMPFGVIVEAATKHDALELLDSNQFDIAFIDLNLEQHLDGLSIVSSYAESGIYTVVLSGHDDDDIVERAYEAGCQDYFEKGNENQSIVKVINKFLIQKNKFQFDSFIKNDFITQDASTIEDLEFAFKNSTSNISMFFTGPTGVGKTILAELIHKNSQKKGRFISINCSEINSNLIESELFGHLKGSFTGATSDKEGRFRAAHNGTLFIDEICSMPTNVQTKLLKVIEEKTFYPVGSDHPIQSNFRLICASQTNIFDKIESGEFRQDLFYRISGINIHLKPLSKRAADIPLLVKHYLKGHRRIVIKEDAMKYLSNYKWPGNVRELVKVLQLLVLQDKGVIKTTDLPPYICEDQSKLADYRATNAQFSYALKNGLKTFFKELEKDIILRALEHNNGVVRQTIEGLGITRSKFYASVGTENERSDPQAD